MIDVSTEPPAPRTARRAESAGSQEGDRRVFVVDDHAGYRRALSTVIDLTHGLSLVGCAASMHEALDQAPSLSADLAVIDIHLGDGSGIELTRQLVAADPDLLVLLVSTTAAVDLPADADTCGALGFVRKDRFGPRVLTAALATVAAVESPAHADHER